MNSAADDNPQDFDGLYAERERRDAEDQTAATSPGGDTKKSSAVDATCLYEADDHDKQQRDVAFAVATLEAGHLTERQLANAVKDWTVHGDQALAAHLVGRQLLAETTAAELRGQADTHLQDAHRRALARGDSAGGSVASSVLCELDSNGRVLKLLGLSVATDWEAAGDSRRVFTEYKLLKKLGQGGMGTVWLARDDKLGRLVAIKEVRSSVRNSESIVQRFRREAQVTGRLEHPSIVPVHQLADEDENGSAFYVMRFLGKRTLEDAIAEYHERRDAGDTNPMHLHHLLTAFVTVCQALAFAHSRNVVHRDLKPENIALDDYGQVIVLDWGLAKLTGRGELQELFGDIELDELGGSGGTMAGQVLGSPMYMAPEQAAGRNDEIEPTTDIYGLGAILFAILTGFAPHEKSHASLTSTSKVSELFQAIVSSPAPSARSVESSVPPELDAICAKAMANKRYARYATALELAEDVQRWMAAEPVSTYVEPWRKRARRWMAMHRRISQLIGVAATVMIVTAVTFGVTAHQNRRTVEHARFEGLKADGRQLGVSLQAVAEDLVKDVRFMAALPPIQAIIRAREGVDMEDEDVWHERLQTIYRGLLEANPKYLSASYASVADGANVGVKEIVRVERQSAGSFVRVLPTSRLATLQSTGVIARALRLKPGEVAIDDASSTDQAGATAADSLVLSAGIPVYSDMTGEIFGIVTIETDLDKTVRELLTATVEAGENAYVIDSEGIVIMHYSRDHDFQHASFGKKIGTYVEGAERLFSPDDSTGRFSDDRGAYGIKIPLDPRDRSATLGVVLTLSQ